MRFNSINLSRGKGARGRVDGALLYLEEELFSVGGKNRGVPVLLGDGRIYFS